MSSTPTSTVPPVPSINADTAPSVLYHESLDHWTAPTAIAVDSYFSETPALFWDISAFVATKHNAHEWCDVENAWRQDLRKVGKDKFTPHFIQERIAILLQTDPTRLAVLEKQHREVQVKKDIVATLEITKGNVRVMKRIQADDNELIHQALSTVDVRKRLRSRKSNKSKANAWRTTKSTTVSSSVSASSPLTSQTSSANRTPALSKGWKDAIKDKEETSVLSYKVHSVFFDLDLQSEHMEAMMRYVLSQRLPAAPSEIDRAQHNFYSVKTITGLRDLLRNTTTIYLDDDVELEYLWHSMEKLRCLWRNVVKNGKREGWFNIHLYSPFLEIVQNIVGIEEITTECHSLGAQFLKTYHCNIDAKHDFIYRHRELDLDLCVTEGKAKEKYEGERKDAKKLQLAMGANLVHAFSKVPLESKQALHKIKAFGILMSGNEIKLLEAKAVDTELILVYQVAQCRIPTTLDGIDWALDLQRAMIMFARRIKEQISLIRDTYRPQRNAASPHYLENFAKFT
ncbi:hypothetical protein EDD11_001030 [Mortierella claussenii]|nr:hypothetical protein EDD11_001030 [Mortierella claussenii]